MENVGLPIHSSRPENDQKNRLEYINYPGIASEIKGLVDIDQDMRERSLTDDYWDETIDAKHTERMKEIVSEIGWPTVSKVGPEGAKQCVAFNPAR